MPVDIVTASLRRPPAASDAEIRGYLLPRLKAGKRPTYAAMRADLGGGGFSRLVRIRNRVEAELSGERAERQPVDGGIGAAELVAGLEALFERQWKALEEWERRTFARLEAMPSTGRQPVTKAKGVAENHSGQTDRLEAVERRLLAAIDQLKVLPKAQSVSRAQLDEVPPAWARQAAVSATAALDGRLQALEETVRDSAASGQAAFNLAAEIAREVAADASSQLQIARSTVSKAMGNVLAISDRAALLEGIQQTLRSLQGQVGAGFASAAGVADRRAVAIRDVILALVDIEEAQCEMFEATMFYADASDTQRQTRIVPSRPRVRPATARRSRR
jgi:hypothetical protein